MQYTNRVKFVFPSYSKNEGFARGAAALFAASLDPTVEEISDIKAAVSEAVTNCIVHAYPDSIGNIEMELRTAEKKSVSEVLPANILYIKIRDRGVGISDIEQAMTPMYTSRPDDDRAGLGFAVMESFTDGVKVVSSPGKGTTVALTKRIKTAKRYVI
ncbi:anti-sigma F factor [Clostridia bacterium]|nr:anti-sigma F factor [Clostridia bacterium]